MSVEVGRPSGELSSANRPSIVACLVTFNRRAMLERAVTALLDEPIDGLVVVDNGSSDGSREWLASLTDRRLDVVYSLANSGGAGGFEQATRRAVARHEADWLLLQDDDAYPDAGVVSRFRSLLSDLDSDVGGVAAAVYTPSGEICEINRPGVSPFGSWRTIWRALFGGRDALHIPHGAYTEGAETDVDCVSFVGYFIRAEVTNRIGFPRGDFFIYSDDQSYSYSLRRHGWKNLFVPSLRYWHDTSSKSESGVFTPTWKVYYLYRNNIEFYREIAGRWFIPSMLVKVPTWILRSRRYPNSSEYLKIAGRGIVDGFWRRFDRPASAVMEWPPGASGGGVGESGHISGMQVVCHSDFYKTQNPHLRPGQTMLEHYREVGWRKGLRPHPLFATTWYVQEFARREGVDVADVDFGIHGDPLTHYLEVGWLNGFDPSPLMSTSYYREWSQRLGRPDINPLVDYLSIGCSQGRLVGPRHQTHMGAVRAEASEQTIEIGAQLFAAGAIPTDLPIEAMLDLSARLVTFDVWDTLIRRMRPADTAKVATARRIAILLGSSSRTWELFERRVQVEADLAQANPSGEYELGEVLAQVLTEVGFEASEALSASNYLVDMEIVDEAANTGAFSALATMLSKLSRRSDAKVAILSDFYIGADGLKSILASNDIDVSNLDVLVSCDIGASKRLGTAYQQCREKYGVGPGEHLHIGDNHHSDIEQALADGGKAVKVTASHSPWPGPGELTRDWYRDLPKILVGEANQMLVPSSNAHRDSWQLRRARRAGGAVAVIAVAHVAAAIDAALERSIPVVHYLSREGAFLSQIHREVGSILAGDDAPRAIHLEVSRRATFGPSLGAIDDAAIALISRQYPEQSIVGLLTSLGIDVKELEGELLTLPGDPTEIRNISNDLIVREFLDRPAVRAVIEQRWGEQSDLLRRYLSNQGLDTKSVVVDVGWRGTIQDNINRLLPDNETHGVYLGLFPFLNPQPPRATKQAVAFDGNMGDTFNFLDPPAVIESPFTPVMPTCGGYEAQGQQVVPVRIDEPGRSEAAITAMQQAALSVAASIAERLVAFGATPDLLKPGMAALLEDVYSAPPGGIADAWFDSGHDDTFGAANITPYAKLPIDAELLIHDTATVVLPQAQASRWVPGYVNWAPVDAADGLRWLIRNETDV